MKSLFRPGIIPAFVLSLFAASAVAQMTLAEHAAQLSSFELVWAAVRDHNPDPKLNGLDWQAVHDSFRPRIAEAKSTAEVRGILREMVGKLGVSHYAMIPGDLYSAIGDAAAAPSAGSGTGIEAVVLDGKAVIKNVAPDSPAARAGIQPGMLLNGIDGDNVTPLLNSANALSDTEATRLANRALANKLRGTPNAPAKLDLLDASGQSRHVELSRSAPVPASVKEATVQETTVQFGNLPRSRVEFESRTLAGGIGYIRFNEFLDPVTLMPRFQSAMHGFAQAPGVILDLRGNPGGIGIMAMGVAGFFIGDSGHQLGVMKMRDATLKFAVFPRAETYDGRVAILLDEGSASTTEILAQGMQDLKRARVFGSRSAGAALPSDIVRLPNGDGFQYPTASYTSSGGRILEGNGVIPDVEVHQSREAIAAGRDLVIDAAVQWLQQP